MTTDVYEPLARYRDEFRDRFARLAQEKFRELTKASGVDVDANRRTNSQIRRLEKRESGESSAYGWLVFLAVASFALAAAGGLLAANFPWKPYAKFGWAAVPVFGALGFLAVRACRRKSREIDAIRADLARCRKEARRQMEPLNALYTWDITAKLIEAAVPRLAFDPYFTADRLDALRRRFGWSDAFNEGRSILFAQSGEINGNPFVFGHYLEMEWGTKTYEGSLHVEWKEWEEDSEGHSRLVTRSQTLVAHVNKPVPVHSEHKFLAYGNDAAPNLTFSRTPNDLSGAEEGFVTSLRRKWRLGRLKAYSRNLDDASQFTLMANHEFETLFNAPNRDNEVEFRLLFTSLAQTQMLALLKDRSVGYGDDFSFVKSHRVNLLTSLHLDSATLDTDPARFRGSDFDRVAAGFLAFNNRYFKDVYFALAPVLAIPLYQQTRTYEDIWKGVVDGAPSSFWEHEALANYYGDDKFGHPASVTRNILKTSVSARADGTTEVSVTAHGYRGVDRVDYVAEYGGDGCLHEVPVRWVEYLPVSRTKQLVLTERETPPETFRKRAPTGSEPVFRRSIHSFLARGAE